MNLDQYPDITPKTAGATVIGIIHTVMTVDVGGYDYYDMLLVDPTDQTKALGRVKMSQKTWSGAAYSEKSKYALGSDPQPGLGVKLSRSLKPNQHGNFYWNVERMPGTPAPEPKAAVPMPKPAANVPVPAPSLALVPEPSITETIDAASALLDRYERYMDLADKLLKDRRLAATDTIINFDINAACFAILKGGW